MTISPLGEDFPPLDEQLRSGERVGVLTLATLSRRLPGSSGTFALNLEPGRYGMLCYIRFPDGTVHAEKGMNAEFRVA